MFTGKLCEMALPYRFAVCNEVFGKTPLRQTCARVRALGYDGIELAPFTLSDDPVSLSRNERQEIARTIEQEGLEFVGLHWLLVSPAELHATTSDLGLRRRTWDYIRGLVDLCSDLGDRNTGTKGVVVFGSPRQRSTVPGVSPAQAIETFTEEIARLAPHAEGRGVEVLIEALPKDQSDVINRLEEAVRIVEQVGSPAIQSMFDTHNTADETESGPELIRKYLPFIRHVHVNEMNGQEPGMGTYDFASVLRTLADLDYSRWVSLEAFDFTRDPDEIAGRAIRHLKASAPVAESSYKL